MKNLLKIFLGAGLAVTMVSCGAVNDAYGNNGSAQYPTNNGTVYRSPDGTVYRQGDVYSDRNGNIYQNGRVIRTQTSGVYGRNDNAKRLPPGQAKKIYGGSAKDYAPGQMKKRHGHDDDHGSGHDKKHKSKKHK
ncbi:hypothetical protein [Chryseobacterium sp. legu1]|uniref:hypothetical protein n=1 Tax=Chryseobacterium sp. TaxID=1871047 RepID=UPI0011C9BD03|nr:hypothetical protein FUA25_03075 [Chryseobacterium sp.]